MDVHVVLNGGLIAAMDEVGDEFAKGTIFVPEMLMAARAMKSGLQVLRPILTQTGEPPKGKVLLATVQGDVHDIGKKPRWHDAGRRRLRRDRYRRQCHAG